MNKTILFLLCVVLGLTGPTIDYVYWASNNKFLDREIFVILQPTIMLAMGNNSSGFNLELFKILTIINLLYFLIPFLFSFIKNNKIYLLILINWFFIITIFIWWASFYGLLLYLILVTVLYKIKTSKQNFKINK